MSFEMVKEEVIVPLKHRWHALVWHYYDGSCHSVTTLSLPEKKNICQLRFSKRFHCSNRLRPIKKSEYLHVFPLIREKAPFIVSKYCHWLCFSRFNRQIKCKKLDAKTCIWHNLTRPQFKEKPSSKTTQIVLRRGIMLLKVVSKSNFDHKKVLL